MAEAGGHSRAVREDQEFCGERERDHSQSNVLGARGPVRVDDDA